jgi:small subunit ribosomal protein S16
MAVKIRLKRFGNKDNPSYRVVVASSQRPRDGKILESVGIYNPMKTPSLFEINTDRLTHWLTVGAQVTDPVKRLITKHYESIADQYPKRVRYHVPTKQPNKKTSQ